MYVWSLGILAVSMPKFLTSHKLNECCISFPDQFSISNNTEPYDLYKLCFVPDFETCLGHLKTCNIHGRVNVCVCVKDRKQIKFPNSVLNINLLIQPDHRHGLASCLPRKSVQNATLCVICVQSQISVEFFYFSPGVLKFFFFMAIGIDLKFIAYLILCRVLVNA